MGQKRFPLYPRQAIPREALTLMEQNPPPNKLRTAVGIYLAAAFTAFLPCLLFQKAYFANDLLYYYGISRVFIQEQLASGHFPLWRPLLLGGQPFFADPNSMAVYPLHYLTLLFSPSYGFGVFFFLHMFLAALGAHFWLKALRLSENACRMGALFYALSGFFWWELIHPPILSAFAWFPWFLAALEKLHKEPKPLNAFWAGLSYALIFVSGNFQIALGIFYTGLLYLALRMADKHGWKPLFTLPFQSKEHFRKTLMVGLFAFWGGFPLFFHLVPAAELSHFSNRSPDQSNYEKFAGTFSMRPWTIYEFLFPTAGVPSGDTIENAIQRVTDNANIDNNFLGNFGYLGAWIPLLMFLAFQRKEKKFLWILAGLSAVSIAAAFGRYFFFHPFLCAVVPGFNLVRAPFRFIDTYVLCACALAAFGYQALDQAKEDPRKSSQLGFIGLVYASVLLIASLIRADETWREILALGLGAAGLSLLSWTQTWKKMGMVLFQAALILPLFLSGWSDFSLGDSSNFAYEGKFPITSTLGKSYPLSRFYMDASQPGYPILTGGKAYQMNLPENLPEALGFRSTGGYNPIFLKKTAELKQLPQDTFLQLMGVRGVLEGRDLGPQKGFKPQVLDSLRLYEMEKPGSFVTTPFQVQVLPDETQVLASMKNPGFVPEDQALLSEALPASITSQLPRQKAQLKALLVSDDADHQVFSVTLDKNSLVTFSEIVYPGWKALLDGQPAALLTSNHVFRTVFVPVGSHRVEFIYEPLWAKPIEASALLWILSVLAYAFLHNRKKPTAA